MNGKLQFTSEDERTDSRDEATQEGIEGECTDEAAVTKLDNAGEHHIHQVSVDQFQFRRCPGTVLLFQLAQNGHQLRHFQLFYVQNGKKRKLDRQTATLTINVKNDGRGRTKF